MQDIREELRQNIESVRASIAAACARAGRSPDSVTLVAVTKYAEIAWVRELIELGVIDLGESRPQQLVRRAQELPDHVRWHFIGHLQRNKAADVVPIAQLIHSVDSLRLFEQLAQTAKGRATPSRVLLEVNVSGELSKDGFTVSELLTAWPSLVKTESLEIEGLMTMAPLADDSEAARPVFRQLRELRDQLKQQSGGRWSLDQLSMGMSGDFEVGIEEGATLVRVGSRLFENLLSTTDDSHR